MFYISLVLEDSPEFPLGGVKRCGIARELRPRGAREFADMKIARSA